MRLKDKVAIVTGAADGIGLAITTAFASQGARVVMVDINETKCTEEAEILKSKGGEVLALPCSVADSEAIRNVVDRTLVSFGKIDILVNNAAIALSGHITQMPDEDWDQLMDINLKGVFRAIKLVMPHMLRQKSGNIINISSLQGMRSWDNWTAYAAAKGAINAMTVQLAGQFGSQGIRVNAIAPGAIMTPLNEKRVKTEGNGFLTSSINQSALGRMGEVEEVAQTAVFLASDEAPFITGENIKIDGGLSTLPRYVE